MFIIYNERIKIVNSYTLQDKVIFYFMYKIYLYHPIIYNRQIDYDEKNDSCLCFSAIGFRNCLCPNGGFYPYQKYACLLKSILVIRLIP